MDSGVGGYATYLAFCELVVKEQRDCPQIYYFADFYNSPYGSKTKQQIVKIVCNNVITLNKRYGITTFVLACNTATACAIDFLRKKFPNFMFFGIEPAIKPALANCGRTLVMMTTATYFSSKYVYKFIGQGGIYFLPLTFVAREIDKRINNNESLDELMTKCLSSFVNKGIQNVVLGCTHYNFLVPSIKRILGNVKFFEPSLAVAQHIIDVCL